MRMKIFLGVFLLLACHALAPRIAWRIVEALEMDFGRTVNFCEVQTGTYGWRQRKVHTEDSSLAENFGLAAGNSDSLDIFPGAPSIREGNKETKKKSERKNRAKMSSQTEGGTSEDADQVQHPSRFPVSDIRSTLSLHPKLGQLVLMCPSNRPTVLVVGATGPIC
ncbi:hypothetical protein DFS33DRAFT_1275095 [Desarmillaria ectypa]|nr:hypothetical protein DFS33DRAFT_1275095 [Desarmillaria ectypa]